LGIDPDASAEGIKPMNRRQPAKHGSENAPTALLRFCLPALLWIALAATHSFAEDLETVVKLPSTSLAVGEPAEISVFVHNVGSQPLPVRLPDRLTCRLSADGRDIHAEAHAVDPAADAEAPLQPNGFIRRAYRLVIPAELAGPVTLHLDELNAPATLFVATEPTGDEALGSHAETTEAPPREYETYDDLFTLYQPYLANISPYEPMYFLVGTDPEESKFQVSFKYQFLNADNPLAQSHPWTRGFHFGYTQTSFWDLESDSAPFDDTSYKPELFYVTSNIGLRPPGVRGFFVQTGIQHESNGRGGPQSRSTNFLYAKPIFIFYNEDWGAGLQVAPKFWLYVNNDDETNPDLKDYRGYFDLGLKFGRAEGLVLGSNFRWAREGASIEVDLTYPLHILFFKNLDLYLQLEYVNALAESLLDFRERTEAFRVGFAIVR